MSKLSIESFEGFPAGELTFSRMDRQFQSFILECAGVILEGTEQTPEVLRAQHHLQIDIPTDYPDPSEPEQSLSLQVIMPITESEYSQFLKPTVIVPEPEAKEPQERQEPEENPGILAMFVPKEPETEDDDEESDEMIGPAQLRIAKGNLEHLARANFLSELADGFMNRVALDEYIASYGVPLSKGQRPVTAATKGIRLQFIGKANRYPLMSDPGQMSSSNNPVYHHRYHGKHHSPFDGRTYTGTVNSSFYDEDVIQDTAEWRKAVREDVERTRAILEKSAATMTAEVVDLYEHREFRFPTPKYIPRFELHRRKEYFEGYQQFARSGTRLLHALQSLRFSHSGSCDEKVRIDVCEKKTDESMPNHVIFWADTEPEATVTAKRLGYPADASTDYYESSFKGYHGDMSSYRKTGQFPDYSIEAMHRSGLSDADMAEIIAGKNWGEIENPFSHKDFLKIVEYLGSLSAQWSSFAKTSR